MTLDFAPHRGAVGARKNQVTPAGCVLSGGHADFAFEGDAEVFDVVEAGAFGDFVEGDRFRLSISFTRLSRTRMISSWGVWPSGFFETAFEEAAGLWDDLEDALDVDAVAGVLADVMHGAGDVAIVDGRGCRWIDGWRRRLAG